ncbi:MAG TPA: hypothetical protein VD741_04545 [Solirubrobacterales bacterium]|nr:hypothetical protein [Solirubrobacterales bacterium]
MTTWDRGVAAIESNLTLGETSKRHWFPWISRVPVVIMGGPGAGKTAIWSKLTGRPAANAMSTKVDKGYFFGRRGLRRTLTVTTIPGQDSEQRYLDIDRYFGIYTAVHGVIFVASFGFDQIWPDESEVTAAELDPFTIEELSTRNIRRELKSFQETCNRIRHKHAVAADPFFKPKWLLVLVNKVDLYWDAIDQARDYYAPGCNSEFDREATELQRSIGTLAGFAYRVIPMALSPMPYVFSSNRGDLPIDSQLEPSHGKASLKLLADTLEELNGS